jgi:hypothetical protein
MNPAVRAAVRTALNRGAEIFAVYEGSQGLVDGGNRIRSLSWDDVSDPEPRRHRDRHRPAHLIGGGGSLSGAELPRQEWPSLLEELVAGGTIDRDTAESHQRRYGTPRSWPIGSTGARRASGGCSCARSSTCWPAGWRRVTPARTDRRPLIPGPPGGGAVPEDGRCGRSAGGGADGGAGGAAILGLQGQAGKAPALGKGVGGDRGADGGHADRRHRQAGHAEAD